jgi:hypothetical protein
MRLLRLLLFRLLSSCCTMFTLVKQSVRVRLRRFMCSVTSTSLVVDVVDDGLLLCCALPSSLRAAVHIVKSLSDSDDGREEKI